MYGASPFPKPPVPARWAQCGNDVRAGAYAWAQRHELPPQRADQTITGSNFFKWPVAETMLIFQNWQRNKMGVTSSPVEA